MNRSSNFIEGRRLKLEKYLKGLQRVAGLQHSNDYMSFLGADQEQAADISTFSWGPAASCHGHGTFLTRGAVYGSGGLQCSTRFQTRS